MAVFRIRHRKLSGQSSGGRGDHHETSARRLRADITLIGEDLRAVLFIFKGACVGVEPELVVAVRAEQERPRSVFFRILRHQEIKGDHHSRFGFDRAERAGEGVRGRVRFSQLDLRFEAGQVFPHSLEPGELNESPPSAFLPLIEISVGFEGMLLPALLDAFEIGADRVRIVCEGPGRLLG